MYASASLTLHGLRESLEIHPVQEDTSISRISDSQSAILRHIKPCITPLSWIAKNKLHSQVVCGILAPEKI